MSMVGVLVEHKGKLCVRYESANYSEPKITRLWWIVVQTTRNPYNANYPQAGDIATYRGSGVWGTHRGGDAAIGSGQSTGSISTGDGNTEAAFVETSEVPRPKVRAGIETRWRDGHWEKYLKSKGWIHA